MRGMEGRRGENADFNCKKKHKYSNFTGVIYLSYLPSLYTAKIKNFHYKKVNYDMQRYSNFFKHTFPFKKQKKHIYLLLYLVI